MLAWRRSNGSRHSLKPRFDLVISSLTIHHLEHAEKRALSARVHSALKPCGAFIDVDQVRGEAPFGELYWMRGAGFEADCICKHYFVAVMLGLESGERAA